MHDCPRCDGKYQKQGLYGHLRMRHGLHDDELTRAYEQALSGSEAERESAPPSEATERRSVPHRGGSHNSISEAGGREREKGRFARTSDPYEALEKLRKAKSRLRVAREETGEKQERRKGAVPFSGTETVTVRTGPEETLFKRCRKEVEQTRNALERALNARQLACDTAGKRRCIE